MRRNDRRAVVEAKHMLPQPSPDDCCEHGLPWEDHCPNCEADLFDVAADLLEDEWTQERRVQSHADKA